MIQVFLLFLFFAVSAASEVQVTVRGVFLCHRNPCAKATIKMMETDPFSDDLLTSTTVKAGNGYKLTGKEDEWWSVEPYLIIEHDCKDVSFIFFQTFLYMFGSRAIISPKTLCCLPSLFLSRFSTKMSHCRQNVEVGNCHWEQGFP
ncbi:hypothetical protein GCK32_009567 [Trichostrongylus colubriformis]|uniref:Transthyretin-like family protein n=1 Tax=Trichostrongylus colubriformis TaxID=6319 RepID=A0AAN8FYJ1_TRICO